MCPISQGWQDIRRFWLEFLWDSSSCSSFLPSSFYSDWDTRTNAGMEVSRVWVVLVSGSRGYPLLDFQTGAQCGLGKAQTVTCHLRNTSLKLESSIWSWNLWNIRYHTRHSISWNIWTHKHKQWVVKAPSFPESAPPSWLRLFSFLQSKQRPTCNILQKLQSQWSGTKASRWGNSRLAT